MKAVNPYLNFAGNTEEAFDFYRSVFGGEFIGGVTYYKDADMGQAPEEDLKVAHVALPLGRDTFIMGTDILPSLGQSLTVGNRFYIHLEVESLEEGERLFNGLSADGEVEMPLQNTGWAEQFGSCVDRFGVQWMIMFTGGGS